VVSPGLMHYTPENARFVILIFIVFFTTSDEFVTRFITLQYRPRLLTTIRCLPEESGYFIRNHLMYFLLLRYLDKLDFLRLERQSHFINFKKNLFFQISKSQIDAFHFFLFNPN
jgi:hypothetical protein